MNRRSCDYVVVQGARKRLLIPPAYPYTARQIFSDLRSRLTWELQRSLTFGRLARIIGQPTSTTHHWFEIFDHPHVIAFLTLLERLSSVQRQAFIDRYCRSLPTIDDPCLSHAPSKIGQLREFLREKNGLTILTGGSDSTRTFLLTALGHAHVLSTEKLNCISGIDVHRPTRFVPLDSVHYIDPAGGRVSDAVTSVLPRISTAIGKLLVFNGVWYAVPEARQTIVQCARRNHVLLAEAGKPDLVRLQNPPPIPIRLVTLSAAKRVSGGISIRCRRLSYRKWPKQ